MLILYICMFKARTWQIQNLTCEVDILDDVDELFDGPLGVEILNVGLVLPVFRHGEEH